MFLGAKVLQDFFKNMIYFRGQGGQNGERVILSVGKVCRGIRYHVNKANMQENMSYQFTHSEPCKMTGHIKAHL